MDLMATLLELAGLSDSTGEKQLDGVSLLPQIENAMRGANSLTSQSELSSNDHGELAGELARPVAQQQVVEAVIRLRDEDCHALGADRVAELPAHVEALGDLAKVPTIASGNTHVYGQYTLQVEDREALRRALAEEDIPTAVHYPRPLHLQQAFEDLGGQVGDYPVSERASAQVVSLPMSPFLSEPDQDRVIAAVRKALGESAALTA